MKWQVDPRKHLLLLLLVLSCCSHQTWSRRWYTTRFKVGVIGHPLDTPITLTRTINIHNFNTTITVYWYFQQHNQMQQVYKHVTEKDLDALLVPNAFTTNQTLRRSLTSLHTTPCSCFTSLVHLQEYGIENSLACVRERKFSQLRGQKAPNYFSKSHLFMTLIEHMQWDSVIVLYDASYESEVDFLISKLGNAQILLFHICPTLLANEDKVEEQCQGRQLQEVLDELVQISSRDEDLRFILLCSSSSTISVLNKVKRISVFDPGVRSFHINSKWLAAIPIKRHMAFLLTLRTVHNVAVIDFMDSTVAYPRLCSTQNMMEIVSRSLPKGLNDFVNRSHESRLTASDVIGSLSKIMNKLRSDCPVAVVQTLYYGEKRSRFLGHVGLISSNLQMEPFGHGSVSHQVFPNRQFALNTAYVRIGVLQEDHLLMRRQEGNRTFYEGYTVDVLQEMGEHLNFTPVLYEPSGPCASEDQREEARHMQLACMLERREIDLMVSKINSVAHISEGAGPHETFFADETTVVFKLPNPDVSKWHTIFRPLKWEVYCLIGLCALLLSCFATILERFNPVYKEPEKAPFHHLDNTAWHLYGLLITQGMDPLPLSITGKTIVGFWSIFAMVTAAMYSGTLTSFLTVTKDIYPFQTLEGMADQDEYTFGLQGGSLLEASFRDSTDPAHKKTWERIVRFNQTDSRVLSPDAQLHRRLVTAGKYAYIGSKAQIHDWLVDDCDLVAIKQIFHSQFYSFSLSNGSAFARMMRGEVIRIFESGQLAMFHRNWWKQHTFCPGALVTESAPVSILDLQSAFYILVSGLVFSGLFLSLEACVQVIWTLHYWEGRPRHLPRATQIEVADEQIDEPSTTTFSSPASRSSIWDQLSNTNLAEAEEQSFPNFRLSECPSPSLNASNTALKSHLNGSNFNEPNDKHDDDIDDDNDDKVNERFEILWTEII